jgi:hypothetical protein
MSDDIVERLRGYVENIRGTDEPPENYLCWQAADEIERLQEQLIANDAADRLISLSDIRNDALEEAAKVAEEWEPLETLLPFADESHNEAAHTGQYEAGERIAAAIRVLKEKTSD